MRRLVQFVRDFALVPLMWRDAVKSSETPALFNALAAYPIANIAIFVSGYAQARTA